jgi:hypothetical protein
MSAVIAGAILFAVMAGLVPAIHVFLYAGPKDVDARDICAKTRFAL